MRSFTSLLPNKWFTFAMALTTAGGIAVPLSAQVINADETGANGGGVAQASYTSSGSYFNRELGTPLRFSYHSEGYGTDLGVVSLGTMKVFNLDGATWFLDGQGTMSDDFGGGFNAGIGYRELVNMSHGWDPDRILGASFWTDGQSTKADNFFTQLGVSLESLGESYDLRLNGYFPLDRTKVSDPELFDFDTVTFSGHELFAGLERITTDTALSVIDAEAAKRIGNLDLWALAGVYQLSGRDEDETGVRAGFRGYVLPDLAIGVQYTDDDVYSTEVMVGLTWFVGRTHNGNAPVGAIVDRFREPVWRNDYIALTSAQTTQGAGGALHDEDNSGELFHFLHVDANAAAGGDGTFENPFNTLELAEDDQLEGSYIFVHANSDPQPILTPTETITLLDNVKLWGEGTNEFGDVVQHEVDSVERGTLVLPETFEGASELDSPLINADSVADDANGDSNLIVLSDDNNINNFRIVGGENIIVADSETPERSAEEADEETNDPNANGINAPELANLDIGDGTNDPTGTAINFTQITGTAVVDNTVTIEGAGTGIFIDRGSSGLNINARVTNSVGSSLVIQNRTGGIIAYGGSIQDNNNVAATADGIVIFNNDDTTINFTQVIDTTEDPDLGININSGDFNALSITQNNVDTIITFADLIASANNEDTVFMNEGGSLTINDSGNESLIRNTGTGDAFRNVGGVGADQESTITIAADIENEGGGNAVDISARSENNVTFNGTIDDTGATTEAILLSGNSGGTIAFNEQVTIDSVGSGFGVRIVGGSDAIVYNFTDIDITTVDGTGFSMLDGGTLAVDPSTGEVNTITTTTGQALVLDRDGSADPLTIGAAGVTFDTVNVSGGTTDSVVLRDIEGGAVTLGSGDDAPDGGTITTNMTAITIDNATNVAVNNIRITTSGADEAVSIVNQEDMSTVAFDGVEINATGAGDGLVIGGAAADANQDGASASFSELVVDSVNGDAVVVQNNEGGDYTFTNLDAGTSGTGTAVNITGNSDDTNVLINGMEIVNTSSGTGFSATAGGTVAVTGDTTVSTNTGTAVVLNDVTVDSAGAQFDGVNVTNATGNGVSLTNLDGTGLVTIGGSAAGQGGTITSAGSAILVDNADNVVITNMTVANGGTAGDGLVIQNQTDSSAVSVTGLDTTTGGGRGIFVQDNTGGTRTLTNSDVNVSGAGTGILVDDNTGGINNFTTTDVDVTSTGAGVNLTDNTGATTNFSSITVNTTSGTGFAASGGGIVAATGTNTVETDSGVAVNLNGVEIGAGGFNLNSVDVNNGTTNGVVLTNLTGLQYRQGSVTATGVNGTGGTITTAGDAIVLSGVTNAVFNDVTANSSAGRAVIATHTITTQATITFDNLMSTGVATSENAVEFVDNGTGEVDFTLRNSEIDMTNSTDLTDANAFVFTSGASSGVVDIRLQDNNLQAADAVAMLATISLGSGNVQFLVTNNEVANDSATLGAAEFNVTAARNVNLTIGSQGIDSVDGNTFTNNNASADAVAFRARSTGGSSRINLDLQDNDAASSSTVEYELIVLNGGEFGIVERDDTFADTLNPSGNVEPGDNVFPPPGGGNTADFIDLNGPITQVD